jgi:copper(I)-binding protein
MSGIADSDFLPTSYNPPLIFFPRVKIMLSNSFRFGALLAALLLSAGVFAGDIKVEQAWARATAPGQDSAGVDLTIISKQDAALVGASSTACKAVELHSMMTAHGSGTMKMREVTAIELPAGKRVNLGEGGYHLMLTGLKSPLKEGESVPLTLDIKVSKRMVKIETRAEVRPLATSKPAMEEEDSGGY